MYNIQIYMRRIIIADEIYMYTDDMYLHIKNNRVWFIDTTLSIRTFINTCKLLHIHTSMQQSLMYLIIKNNFMKTKKKYIGIYNSH